MDSLHKNKCRLTQRNEATVLFILTKNLAVIKGTVS